MTFLEAAVTLDSQDRPAEAAWAYELAISAERVAHEVYLDLAVLYFQTLDAGYFSHHHLPNEFVIAAAARLPAVLDLAAREFGLVPDVEFWKEYSRFVRLGGKEPEPGKYALAARNGSDSAFYLFALRGMNEYETAARKLLMRTSTRKTARQRYVASVLEAAFSRLTPGGHHGQGNPLR